MDGDIGCQILSAAIYLAVPNLSSSKRGKLICGGFGKVIESK
jgi:hypothetical protein